MKLRKIPRDELQLAIQRRAIEIAAGEGDSTDIPVPGVYILAEPVGLFGIRWALSDFQNVRGRGYIEVAAAELSAQWDVELE